jgi:hypothetical protein
LRDEKPQQALRYLERFTKKFQMLRREDVLLRVIALAQQGLMPLAWQQLHNYDVVEVRLSVEVLPISWSFRHWFFYWINKIERYEGHRRRAGKLKETLAARRTQKEAKQTAPKAGTKGKSAVAETEAPLAAKTATESEFPPLPRYDIQIPLSLSLPESLEAELVFNAWVETTAAERATAFEALGEKMAEAKAQYDAVKALDEELFGEDFVAA